MTQQRTLKNVIRATGVGLHSGEKVYMTLRPAPADSGIVFRRIDLEPVVEIPADARARQRDHPVHRPQPRRRQGDDRGAPDVGDGRASASTTPTSNCPRRSCRSWTARPVLRILLQSAGVVEQNAPKRFIRIKHPVEARDGDKLARFTPYDGFRLGFTVVFDHPMIPASQSRAEVEFSTAAYIREVARARTFGFMRDLEYMRERNLGLGGSMDNAIVLDEFRVLNDDGLRYADEFVRHKILDAVGDLYLAGHPILGAYEGFKSGHALNNKLVRALLATPTAWEEVSFDSAGQSAPVAYASPAAAR
jgi:UDP-3-O-[3-hydroxymyristoyl] N-acetylglucosamine deacetylase